MGERHLIDSIAFKKNTADTEVVLGAISPATHDINQTVVATDSAYAYVENHFIADATEQFTFNCRAIGTLLSEIALLGPTCLDEAGAQLDLYGQTIASCQANGRAAGAAHRRVRSTKSRLFIRSISMSGSGDVVASVEGVLLSTDGEAAPTTTVYNVTLPASPNNEELFRRGAVQIAGVALQGDAIQSVSIDTANEYTVVIGNGVEATGIVYVKSRPTISITTQETDLYSSGKLGRSFACVLADTTIDLRRRDTTGDGELVATNVAEHARFSAQGRGRVTQPISGDSGSPNTCQVVIDCSHATPGTAPLQALTGIALT